MRVALACVAVSVVSLLVFTSTTYDPTAWLIWGRQISHGTLDTVAGPSWKPLPVLFTTPFSLFGDTVALKLWLVVARVGGLGSLVMAFRLAARLGGRAAGAIAALALLLATDYTFNWIRGNSEGLLVATALLAGDALLEGRHRHAFGWGVAAALLRPEIWPLEAVYGLWLLRETPDRRTAALVLGSGLAVALLWFAPEYVGSGDLLRGAARARDPVEGSPGSSDDPFLATFANSAEALSYGVYAGAVLSLAAARRDRAVAGIAVAATALMVMVALLATGGFTGSLRYVSLPAALLCVLSGVGWAWLARALGSRRWLVLGLCAVAVLPGLASAADHLGYELGLIRQRDRLYAKLPDIVEQAGGESAIKRCGAVFTGRFQTQALAYELHLRQDQVGLRPRPPGTIIDGSLSPLGRTPDFTPRGRNTEWIALSTC